MVFESKTAAELCSLHASHVSDTDTLWLLLLEKLQAKLWCLNVLFIMMIFTTLRIWRLNAISRSKKLNVGYKSTAPRSHDFSVTIVKRPTTLLVFIIKHFPWKFELASSPKHNEAVKTFFFFVCSGWWWLMSLTTSVVPLGHLLIKHDNILSLTLNLTCLC